MVTWDEIAAARLAEVQEKQALHRRLLKAREAGMTPDVDDTLAAADHASEYQLFDRVNASDDD